MFIGLPTSTTRTILFLLVTLTTMAILVGRAYPEQSARRERSEAPYQLIERGHGGGVVLVDRESGRFEAMSTPHG